MTLGNKKYSSYSSKLSLMKKNCFKKLISIELIDPEDPEKPGYVKQRLQSMELLEKKLKIQRNTCAFGIIFTVTVYFLFWYKSECWALPFQESPCKQPRDLPLISTNQSTLADAVDEFTLALRTQITKFRDGIEISHLADRKALYNITKDEIRQLFSHYTPDLLAFAALKREDERLKEMEVAIVGGYLHIHAFLLISTIFLIYIAIRLIDSNHPEKSNNQKLSAEESENLQNSRLRQLEKRIPLLYIATLICIALEVTLFFTFFAGHIYGGSSPIFKNDTWNAMDCSNTVYIKNCTFTDYPSYATKLEAVLNKQISKLDNYTASPLIEVRQMAWMYESGVINVAIEDHLHLKRYNVNRRTMPRKIGIVFPNQILTVPAILPEMPPFLYRNAYILKQNNPFCKKITGEDTYVLSTREIEENKILEMYNALIANDYTSWKVYKEIRRSILILTKAGSALSKE
ncbi:hypothetical protein Ddc_10197 [Ditylenchus destructor]|nr:hypothetical protein Ddc_10197 [Ditylenchus destructor]